MDAVIPDSNVEGGEFFCPQCSSFDVEEIGYEDDFGSMACKICGYQGDPGEDFPSTASTFT